MPAQDNSCRRHLRWGAPKRPEDEVRRYWGTSPVYGTSLLEREAWGKGSAGRPREDQGLELIASASWESASAIPARLAGLYLLRLRAEDLRPEFTELAEQWRRETKFLSSIDEKVLHSAYQSIIAMGMAAVPLVLEELESRRGHWVWALHFMTKGANPLPEGANVDDARESWLAWGRRAGYLK
jgi:hypothetical protein